MNLKKSFKENLFISTRVKLDFIAAGFVFFILFTFSFVVYKLLTQDIIYQISPIFKYLEGVDGIDSAQFFGDLRRQTLFLLIVSDLIIFTVSILLFDRMVKKMLEPIEDISNIQKRFASNVSHELRTPLSIMTMRGEILMSKIEKEESRHKSPESQKFISETKDGVGVILQEVSSLTNIIDDLLFESRLKYVENKQEDITIEEILKIAKKSFEGQINLKNNEVEYKIDNSLKKYKHIKANPLHLERIFHNLISNSFKYTNKGEVKVSLAKYKYLGKFYLKISFIDTGIGIKKEDLPKISDRFYRGKNIEEEISGTGIGLSIVRGIVDSNNWHMHIKSEEGIGTLIEISKIPLDIQPIKN